MRKVASCAHRLFLSIVLPFFYSVCFASLFSPVRRAHCAENFRARAGPRRRLPYLCETATLLIFQRSRRVACRNEIISSTLIFSPCGAPPGHHRQPPRRFPLKTRGHLRTPPSRMSHSAGTGSTNTLHPHPLLTFSHAQVGRLAHGPTYIPS